MSDLHIDHDDLKHGFAIGKAHKLAEWSFRKDEREFEKLCNRLYHAKWMREVRAENGERWQRVRESWRRCWRRRHEADKAKRVAAWEASLRVRPCAHCGTTFPTKLQSGRPRKWCSKSCATKHAYEHKREDVLAALRRRTADARAALPPASCSVCGVAIERKTTKPRKHCSRRCQTKDYRSRHGRERDAKKTERRRARRLADHQEHAPA